VAESLEPSHPPRSVERQLSPSAQRVQDALTTQGFPHEVVEHTETTRSAADAARAIGCRVEQIAKSLVFKGSQSGRAVLVIATGTNRVHEQRIGEYLSEPIERADPDFVRQVTGFAIGGVPPVGHSGPLEIFIDADFAQQSEIWAAGGTPNAVFRLTPEDLIAMTGGRVVTIT
jgi:prolyl-tRNA editing enzyme YbaK/EbsC (Cys-tRNA(Pro) deacylase)